ncbi:MarR family winged helix-turn-helix transcriptional regulator [Jiella sp. M17.18]|uniref:MarR family winged helix-turn-helix transcriptional regulator n=1 Tax=Jiella sp. M17.18 TaxID=3234247 RepID=UPI0034DFA5BF
MSESRTSEAEKPLLLVPPLLTIGKATRALSTIALGKIGLVPGHDVLLDALDPERPVTINVLADVINIRPSTASKMIDHLEAKGYVARYRGTVDKRKTMIALLPPGIDAREQVHRIWREMDADLVAALGPDELRDTRERLEQVRQLLDRRLRRLR